MTTYYKFLNLKQGEITSKHGEQIWKIGKEYSVKGDVVKCKNGFHASVEPLDALYYVKGDVLALVSVSGDSDNDTNKVCYRTMKIEKAYKWTQKDSVTLAIYAAEQVIKLYEDKYPNDSRPREAIKAAKAYLKDPSKKNKEAAADAASAAADAASAPYAAADAASATDAAADAASATDAANAATYAANAAADAASAAADAASATDAANAATYAANAAADAASAAYAATYAAADADYAPTKGKINRKMKSMVKNLEELK